MKLENEFTVPAPVDRAWEVLLDLERVAPCLPGAAIDGREGDAHTGTMTVKIGPITARYKGTVKIEESDEAGPPRGHARAGARRARSGHGGRHDHLDDGGRRRRHARAGGDRHADHRSGGAVRPRGDAGRERQDDGPLRRLPRGPDGGGRRARRRRRAAEGPQPAEEATAAAPADEERAPAAAAPPPPPPPPRPTEEVLDLGEVSRDAVLKRVAPVAAGAVGLLLLLVLRRRR